MSLFDFRFSYILFRVKLALDAREVEAVVAHNLKMLQVDVLSLS